MKIELATIQDVPELQELQHRAFGPQCIELGWEDAPPMTESLEHAYEDFAQCTTLKVQDEEGRIINDRVVLDTLPSGGAGGSVSADTLTENAKNIGSRNDLKNMIASSGAEILLIVSRFDNHVTAADDREHFFVNEWEYIIKGSPDDEVNYRACRRRLFLARNALNLLSLYRDPAKVEIVIAVAETIT